MPTGPDDAVATAQLIDQCYRAAGSLRARTAPTPIDQEEQDPMTDPELEPLPEGVFEKLWQVSTSTIATQCTSGVPPAAAAGGEAA